LRDIQATLILNGKKCEDFSLPTPPTNFSANPVDQYNDLLHKQFGHTMISTLNDEQKMEWKLTSMPSKVTVCPTSGFTLMALAVQVKLTCTRHFLAPFRGDRKIGLAAASTGIAANLLDGGRTYHSQFKLPVPLLETSVSSMSMTSADAHLILKADLLIWDGSTMAPGIALNACDRLLKEIMQNQKPFGGKTLLLGGDFRTAPSYSSWKPISNCSSQYKVQ